MMWALAGGGIVATIAGVIGAALAFCAGDYNTGASPWWAPFVFILSVISVVAGVVAILYPVGLGIVSWIL